MPQVFFSLSSINQLVLTMFLFMASLQVQFEVFAQTTSESGQNSGGLSTVTNTENNSGTTNVDPCEELNHQGEEIFQEILDTAHDVDNMQEALEEVTDEISELQELIEDVGHVGRSCRSAQFSQELEDIGNSLMEADRELNSVEDEERILSLELDELRERITNIDNSLSDSDLTEHCANDLSQIIDLLNQDLNSVNNDLNTSNTSEVREQMDNMGQQLESLYDFFDGLPPCRTPTATASPSSSPSSTKTPRQSPPPQPTTTPSPVASPTRR